MDITDINAIASALHIDGMDAFITRTMDFLDERERQERRSELTNTLMDIALTPWRKK